MELLCDFCGVVRALVYCKSDSARLCLHCDTCVHSANALSRRHPRSLICDKCYSQPAKVRCMDDTLSLCQGCEWTNGNGCSGSGHRLQKLTCYTGCPSMADLSKIWSSVLDVCYPISACNSSFSSPMSTLHLNENSINSCLDQCQNEGSSDLVANTLNELSSSMKLESFASPSPAVPSKTNYVTSFNKDQTPFFPEGLTPNLPHNPLYLKELELGEGDDLCEGVDLDDVALSFDGGYDIFGCSQGQSRCQCDDGGLDCLGMEKNLSVTESNCHIENALEATSTGQQDCITFQSPQVKGSANMMQAMIGTTSCMLLNSSCNRNIGLTFSTGSLSLSNITGESSAADYQDCGLSPAFLAGESPWESSLEISSPQARDKAKMRYNEKKKTRTFGKQIRYASRKARADTRKRVKGRFVKAGEAYDYDPLGTRHF